MIVRTRPSVEILVGSSIMKIGGRCFDTPQHVQKQNMREAWEAEPCLLRCQAEPHNEAKCCGLVDRSRALILAVELR
jgi:hypothetical protein